MKVVMTFGVGYYEHGRLDDVVEINKPWGASINILKFMSFSEISKFLKDPQGRMIDVYWSNFAANISLPIIKIATSYDEFEKLGMRINKEELTMSSIEILQKSTLERELILLLAALLPTNNTRFAKINGSKKYCRKGEQEVEQMALREVERAVAASLSGDFSCYSAHAKRPQRMREALLQGDRLLLADTIISHFNSHYQIT